MSIINRTLNVFKTSNINNGNQKYKTYVRKLLLKTYISRTKLEVSGIYFVK